MAETLSRTVMEKTSVPQNFAEKLFHIEYYFHLIVNLVEGAEVGCEIKDDCHIDCIEKGQNKLVQLKHTILNDASGKLSTNLANKDSDLWHTVSNWVDVICDENDGRKGINEQIDFLGKTKFELVTNKQIQENEFVKVISQLQNGKISIADASHNIKALIGSDNSVVDGHIQKLLSKTIWLESLLKRIEITQYTFEQLNESILAKIRSFFFTKEEAISLYIAYYTKLKDQIYKGAKGKRIVISNAEFRKGFEECVRIHRKLNNIVTHAVDDTIPDAVKANLTEQIFVKQLSDIDSIDDENDMENIAKLRFRAYNSYNRWVNDEAALDHAIKFDEDKAKKAENSFKEIYNTRTKKLLAENTDKKEELLIQFAQDCLSVIRKHQLNFGGQSLDTPLSNGHFYWLSDIPKMGYRFDWKEKYTKHED